jgi:microcompartment protein CcmK/EutM
MSSQIVSFISADAGHTAVVLHRDGSIHRLAQVVGEKPVWTKVSIDGLPEKAVQLGVGDGNYIWVLTSTGKMFRQHTAFNKYGRPVEFIEIEGPADAV